MPPEPIRFRNRNTGEIETEEVYGESFLRWTYETGAGRTALWSLAKRALFSRWYGWRMDRPGSRAKVRPFVETYGLDPESFARGVDDFATFNEFFYRELASSARPIDPDPASVIFPADGRHFGFEDVSQADGVFVKGQRFDISALVGDPALGERYRNGSLILSRLCPVDYHRFHFPCAGQVVGEPRLINGDLFSVSPIALRRRLAYLWENKRVLTELDGGSFGRVLVIEVGATCVGTIIQTAKMPGSVEKGQEKGYFAFGGSSTITLFEPGKVKLAADLVANSNEGLELYAKMGERMGGRAD